MQPDEDGEVEKTEAEIPAKPPPRYLAVPFLAVTQRGGRRTSPTALCVLRTFYCDSGARFCKAQMVYARVDSARL